MAQELAFQLSLTGNFASALRPVNEGLGNTEGKAKHASKSLELFEAEMGKAKAGAAGFSLNLSALAKGGSLLTFDMAEGAGAVLEVFKGVYEIASKVVEKTIDLGKEMLKTAANTQDLDLAVELNLGKEGAGQFDKLVESFESTSRFDASDLKKAALPLLEQGLTDMRQLDDLMTVSTDLAARRNQGIEGVASSLESFGKIALRGEVNWKMLGDLKVSQADFLKNLSDLRKKHESPETLKALMDHGGIASKTLLSVALDEIQKREGGSIGPATMRAGDNLNGMWARFSRLPEQYFEKLANSPALDKLAAAIGRALEALDPASPTGARISAALDSIINQFTEWTETLTQGTTLDAIAKGVRVFADDVVIAVKMTGAFVDGLRDIFDWSTKLLTPLAKVSNLMGDFIFGKDKAGATGLAGDMPKLFEDFQNGKLSKDQIKAAVANMGDGTKDTLRKKLQLNATGEQPAAALGIEGGAGMVDDATRSSLADRAFGSTVSAPPGAGSKSVSINVQIDGAGKHAEDLGAEFERRARNVVLSIMDDVAHSNGGT
jgi:hypothetical protein